MDLKKKTKRLITGSFLLYALLVATHLGEFWPFSIYPMFSIAGRPWNRALIRDIKPDLAQSSAVWNKVKFPELPGEQIAMTPLGISQNDLATMVSKTKVWDKDRVDGLRGLFAEQLKTKTLLVYKARGEKVDDKEEPVKIEFTPFILMNADTSIFNPELEVKTQAKL